MPALQLNQSFLGSVHSSRDRGSGGLDGQVVSVKRKADGSSWRRREIIDEEG